MYNEDYDIDGMHDMAVMAMIGMIFCITLGIAGLLLGIIP